MTEPLPPTSAQLGAAIRALRSEQGLTIEGLAAEADVHWTYLSGIENGKRSPSWDVVNRLAAALEVDMGALSELAARQPG